MDIVVFITVPNKKEAQKIAGGLVKKRLAACVNMCAISSIFSWKGKIESCGETLLIAKTTMARFGSWLGRRPVESWGFFAVGFLIARIIF
jgi:uncharacterized protein involved in tolerance to divalent cations